MRRTASDELPAADELDLARRAASGRALARGLRRLRSPLQAAVLDPESGPVSAPESARSQARAPVSEPKAPLRLGPEQARVSVSEPGVAELALAPAQVRVAARPAEDATRPLLPELLAWEPRQVRASGPASRLARAKAAAQELASESAQVLRLERVQELVQESEPVPRSARERVRTAEVPTASVSPELAKQLLPEPESALLPVHHLATAHGPLRAPELQRR